MKRWFLALGLALVGLSAAIQAHEVPDRVRIDAFVKTEPKRLVMLVRMPANALIDYLLPTLEAGNWLDLPNCQPMAMEGARVWIADLLTLRENGVELPKPTLVKVRLSRLNDSSFTSFAQALERIDRPPLPVETLVLQDQVTVDALLEVSIGSDRSTFDFTPRFGRLGLTVDTTLTFLPAAGGERVFRYEGDPPAFELDPPADRAFSRFWRVGVSQLARNSDTWLVIVGVALALHGLRRLTRFALAFIWAQAMVIATAAASLPTIPGMRGLIGVLIAVTAVYLGTEVLVNARTRQLGLAIMSGVIVGAAFTLTLQPVLQFAGAHKPLALFAFILGLGIAEWIGLLTLSGLRHVAIRMSRAPQAVLMIAAALVVHTAWRRVLERADALMLVPIEARTDTLRLLASAATVVGVAFVVAALLRQRSAVAGGPREAETVT